MPNASTAVPADDINIEDIKSLDSFIEKNPDFTNEARMRWLIFNRKSNGLEASGAIIKRAGRWFVVVPRLKNWLLRDTAPAAQVERSRKSA